MRRKAHRTYEVAVRRTLLRSFLQLLGSSPSHHSRQRKHEQCAAAREPFGFRPKLREEVRRRLNPSRRVRQCTAWLLTE